jgi:hypothetical protein
MGKEEKKEGRKQWIKNKYNLFQKILFVYQA